MANPRYITVKGKPTQPLMDKIKRAHEIYHANLEWFTGKYGLDVEEFKDNRKLFLIGSQAEETVWNDAFSDVDFKLLNRRVLPMSLQIYKKEVLDPLLHDGEKRDWIDMWFAQRDDQIRAPRYDLTRYWLELNDTLRK